MVLAAQEAIYRNRQRDTERYDTLLASAYTIPVSVIAPAYNEEIMVVPAVRSLLAMDYPEYEVIAVDDGSSDATLSSLVREFDLEPAQVFFRSTLPIRGEVRAIYKSRKDPRLTVVSKRNGGKADAMNCGVNFARYRYVCCVDGDTVFTRDALLQAMAVILKDPGLIVAAGSLFGVSLLPENTLKSDGSRRLDRSALIDFQHLDMMRSFVAYRMGWSRLQCMMCVPGAFGLWRRDLILELGGFSSNFTCEDIEMTFRLHEKLRREKRPYRIMSLPSMVAQTEGPSSVKSLISQRARWQRVTLETVWHYRHMFGRRKYGSVGMIGLPYYLLFEAIAPVVQLSAAITLIMAIAYGLLQWRAYVLLLGIMIFATALPTTVAVALHDTSFRDYSKKDLLRMILLGPLDFVIYRPILAYAGVRGFIEFLQGRKDWYRFERNTRQPAAS